MRVSGIQIMIWLLLLADIAFHIFVVRYLIKIDVICSAMKDEYLSLIKKEVARVNTCFDEWKSCIEGWQESFDTNDALIAILKKEVINRNDQA